MKNHFITILKKLFTADYPYCIYCGKEYDVDENILACHTCMDKLVPGSMADAFGFDFTACYAFEGPVRSLVHRYKYNGERHLGDKIARLMQNTLKEYNLLPQMIVHVTLHSIKKKKRGFDQSKLIARKLSALTAIPCTPALNRIKNTLSQTHLTRPERIENVKGVFEIKDDVSGFDILLIDDVLTTGSTAAECARVLMKNGAASVRIMVFAIAV